MFNIDNSLKSKNLIGNLEDSAVTNFDKNETKRNKIVFYCNEHNLKEHSLQMTLK